MGDPDQTVVSGSMTDPAGGSQRLAFNRKPLIIMGGVGCLLLACAALLITGGLLFTRGEFDELLAGLNRQTETPTVQVATLEPSPTAVPTKAVVTTEEPTAEATSNNGTDQTPSSETPTSDQADILPEDTQPEIDDITFALGATPDSYEPVDPGISFTEGITEVHAIFDYRGMSSDYTWERVWYLDGDEILRTPAQWTGDEAGRFNYFIDAGGETLFPGQWVLELYVEGDLLATGSFTIEAAEAPAVAAATDDNAEHAADLETPTPAASPTPAQTTPTATPSETSPSQGGGTYQLAFTKWDGGNHNIYIADTNGNNERLVVTRGAGPSWTPDGQYLFFYGEEGIDRQIRDGIEYVNPNYSVSNGIIRLTISPFPADVTQLDFFQGSGWNEGTARWANVAPNGQMVAFDARPGGGDYRIFFLGTADNQQFQFQILGEHADWSPDGQRVVYRSGRNGTTGLWISNRDDSVHTLVTNGGSDSFPAWSPDGKTVAFSRDEGGNVDIYTMNPNGSNVQRLTTAPGPDTLPVYTPSGDIIFRSARNGKWGIWKMNGTGENQTEIIPDAGVGPDWSYSRMSVR